MLTPTRALAAALGILAIVAVTVLVAGGGGEEEACDPEAAFERPAPRGFTYTSAGDVGEVFVRGAGGDDSPVEADDVAGRRMRSPAGAIASALSIRSIEGLSSDQMQAFILTAVEKDREVSSHREVRLGAVSATRIDLDADDVGRLVIVLAPSGCRLLIGAARDYGTARRVTEHFLGTD